MALLADHIALANRNQNVLDYLMGDLDRCAEWVATVAFYKALHVVEAIFADDPDVQHTANHRDRLNVMKRDPQYRPLFPTYRVLWQVSLIARYLEHANAGVVQGFARFEDYMPTDDIKSILLDRFLMPFERVAVGMLRADHGLVVYRSGQAVG